MRQEIEFFHKKLFPTSEVRWESPIAHIIPRMPTFTTFGLLKRSRQWRETPLLDFGGTLPFPTR
jgi:hypothetical protein